MDCPQAVRSPFVTCYRLAVMCAEVMLRVIGATACISQYNFCPYTVNTSKV